MTGRQLITESRAVHLSLELNEIINFIYVKIFI